MVPIALGEPRGVSPRVAAPDSGAYAPRLAAKRSLWIEVSAFAIRWPWQDGQDREGGNWAIFDVFAKGIKNTNFADDTVDNGDCPCRYFVRSRGGGFAGIARCSEGNHGTTLEIGGWGHRMVVDGRRGPRADAAAASAGRRVDATDGSHRIRTRAMVSSGFQPRGCARRSAIWDARRL